MKDILARLVLAQCSEGHCEARTFHLFQCSRTGSATVSGRRLCMQHAKNWHKQGLVGQPLSNSHEVSLQKHLTKLLSSPTFQWFARDLFWQELCGFGFDNVCDASGDVFLECIATANSEASFFCVERF